MRKSDRKGKGKKKRADNAHDDEIMKLLSSKVYVRCTVLQFPRCYGFYSDLFTIVFCSRALCGGDSISTDQEYDGLGALLHVVAYPSDSVLNLSSSFTMTTFPPELVEIIVHEAWHSEMPSYVRKMFMTTCPRINRTWKAVYAPIASQDMYITNLAFLDYLYRIVAKFRKSIIYRDFIPRLTRTITCFVDLRAEEREGAAKEVYHYLTVLPNMGGFDALFPGVLYLSFELAWIGTGRRLYLEFLRDIPIHARFDRHMSPREYWKPRIDACVTMKDPSAVIHKSIWSHMLRTMSVVDGVRHVHQTTYYLVDDKLDSDSRNINKRLWMAANKRHSPALRGLTNLFHRQEYRRGGRVESPLPSIVGLFRARYGHVKNLLKSV
ncbi:hypothetical protein ARMSODRAFT_1048858 [Armillaria solidipes]|uniref:Uncharacterized protein n=1 Tax=Armillaria solidipes TaxID=1076256 RepID=A0A2H3B7Z0_9AGAR|nr:hypothetical protein ARMSODRAFT_1048858 [Armillaria solidipes]